MKITLIIAQYPQSQDGQYMSNVVDAWDEYVRDDNERGFRDALAKHEALKQSGDYQDVRTLDVIIPDEAVLDLFETPTIKGKVVEQPCPDCSGSGKVPPPTLAGWPDAQHGTMSAKYGTRDCPTCGGQGHMGMHEDREPATGPETTCPECNGTGWVPSTAKAGWAESCPTCNMSGVVGMMTHDPVTGKPFTTPETPWCTCGAKTPQPKGHKHDCPRRKVANA